MFFGVYEVGLIMPNRKSIYGFIYGGNFIAQKAEGFSPQKKDRKSDPFII